MVSFKYHLYMNKIKWYQTYKSNEKKNGLLDHHSKQYVNECKVITAENSKGTYMYALLRSHVDIFHYIISLDTNHRIFSERIDENACQKPRFDIDIDNDKIPPEYANNRDEFGHRVKDLVIETVIKVLKEDNIDIDLTRDILVYNSHGDDKLSYHILVNNYMHSNCHEAGAFYNKIIKSNELLDKYDSDGIIDSSIYHKNHSLRILHCRKRLNLRVKKFEKEFSYKGDKYTHIIDLEFLSKEHEDLNIFAQSLITYVSGCKILPIYALEKKVFTSDIELDEYKKDELMLLLCLKMRFELEDLPYEIFNMSGSLVRLKRTRIHMCPLCNRNHDPNTFPYLCVTCNRYVYWGCGRKKGHKLYLGELSVDYSYVVDSIRLMNEESGETSNNSSILQDQIRELSMISGSSNNGSSSTRSDSKGDINNSYNRSDKNDSNSVSGTTNKSNNNKSGNSNSSSTSRKNVVDTSTNSMNSINKYNTIITDKEQYDMRRLASTPKIKCKYITKIK